MPTSCFSKSESNLSVRTLTNYSGRKSCEFTNVTSSCVNKATDNLYKLQDGLEQWRKETLQKVKSRKVNIEDHKVSNKRLNTPKQKLEAIDSGTALVVYGQESILQVSNIQYPVLHVKEHGCEKYKHVVEGLHHLLKRLENDRSEMESLLEKEKKRTVTLREKIDWHAYRRIKELPVAVQKEHEKCAYDVQELKWHCGYQGRAEARVGEKVRIAENINKKIKEEIEFVKENSPLIEEKLNDESDSMLVIKAKQMKTDQNISDANAVLLTVQAEFDKLKKQADVEQKLLAEKLLTLSSELKLSLQSFLNTQNEHDQMADTICQLKIKTSKNEDEVTLLDKTLTKTQLEESDFEKQLGELDSKIDSQGNAHVHYVADNQISEDGKAQMENNLQSMRKANSQTIGEKTKVLQRLVTGNKNSDKEIASLKRRIEICEKQKISDSKAVKRAVTEREKVQADLQIIKEETDQTRIIHDRLLLRLDQEKRKACEVEDNLSTLSDSLKKQNKEENHARMILQARINADVADFQKKKKDSEKKREKMSKTDDDIGVINATVSAQVEKLSTKYQERLKAINGLTRLLQQLSEKHNETGISLTDEINLLEPKEQRLKMELSSLKSRQEEMDETSKQLDKKLRDMAASNIMMNKLLLSNQKAIDDLNEEISELQIQLDSGQGLESTLRDSLKEVKERSDIQSTIHDSQLISRQTTLTSTRGILNVTLLENKRLAARYIELQTRHINQKNLFVNTYEKSVLAQETLKDKKNLCELHSRLHEALKCYYHLRGVQTKVGLKHFNEMTQKSNKKLQNIQGQLEVSLSNITSFLNANNKSHRVIELQSVPGKSRVKAVS